MKKTIILLAAALVAALTLTASVSAYDEAHGIGTVTFESQALPELNVTMSLNQAAQIYRLAPENIQAMCSREYEVVRAKFSTSSRFTHEGVRIRKVEGDGATVSLEFSTSGYKILVKNATWKDMDQMFRSAVERN